MLVPPVESEQAPTEVQAVAPVKAKVPEEKAESLPEKKLIEKESVQQPKAATGSNKAVLGLMGAALLLTLTIGGLKMSELSTSSKYHEFLANGNEHMERKQWNEAKNSFQNAIELKPDDQRAFDRLSEIRDRERQEFVQDSIAAAQDELLMQDSTTLSTTDSLNVDSLSNEGIQIDTIDLDSIEFID